MIPNRGWILVLTLCLVLVATPGASEEFAVKVSLSREDPNVHQLTLEDSPYYEFFLFLEGDRCSGFEFGTIIEGGELIGYIIDTSKTWMSMPFVNPYPGTISQVAAGEGCFAPPIYVGRLLVKPNEPGGSVVVDVRASQQNEYAVLINCDFSATNGFRAYPAAVNTEPVKAHDVRGEEVFAAAYPKADPRRLYPEKYKTKDDSQE